MNLKEIKRIVLMEIQILMILKGLREERPSTVEGWPGLMGFIANAGTFEAQGRQRPGLERPI